MQKAISAFVATGFALLMIALGTATPNSASVLPTTPGTLEVKRTVKGQTLTSTENPAVQLKFDPSFRYIGGHNFILYDVANAEQHFFVDADAQGRIRLVRTFHIHPHEVAVAARLFDDAADVVVAKVFADVQAELCGFD